MLTLVVQLHKLCWRDVSDRLQQASRVKPIYPFECREFDLFKVTPRPAFMDDFRLEESDDGFGQGVIVGVADTPYRKFDPSVFQPLCVVDGNILYTTVGVVHELIALGAGIQGLLQGIQRQVATYVKSATYNRLGCWAVKLRSTRSVDLDAVSVPIVVTLERRPRVAPWSPICRIRRSIVQRATC